MTPQWGGAAVMTNEDKVLSLLVSLYKEIIDAKAQKAASHGLEPILAGQIEFSHEYRTTVRSELEKVASTLKELGFPENEVDTRLTTLFGDIMHPRIHN